MTAETENLSLIVAALKAFYWLDEGLQNFLKFKGWPDVSRSQSIIMANIAIGVRRPSAIARNIGVSRQAVHHSLGQMKDLGLISLIPDPKDKRAKLAVVNPDAERIQRDAGRAMAILEAELERRLGKRAFAALRGGLTANWGPPLDFPS